MFVVFLITACEAIVIAKSAIKKCGLNSIRLEIGLKIQLIASYTLVVKGK